jgi:Family of unknown function (DUF5763)
MRIKNTLCKGKTKAGGPCTAHAAANGFCFFHDNPTRAVELGHLGGLKNKQSTALSDDRLVSVPVTAKDVRGLLAEAMAEVRNRRLDPRVASTMAYVASALLKALEIEDLESRIEELERNDAGAKQSEKD